MSKCYSTNEQDYYQEDLHQVASEHVEKEGITGSFDVWEADVDERPASHYARGMGEWIAERMCEDACEGATEYAEGWSPFGESAMEAFEKELLQLIDKHAEPPTFFNAINPRKITMVSDAFGVRPAVLADRRDNNEHRNHQSKAN